MDVHLDDADHERTKYLTNQIQHHCKIFANSQWMEAILSTETENPIWASLPPESVQQYTTTGNILQAK